MKVCEGGIVGSVGVLSSGCMDDGVRGAEGCW